MLALRNKENNRVSLVHEFNFEECEYRYCYNEYGQTIGSYLAGDYNFANDYFEKQAKKAAEEYFGKIDWDEIEFESNDDDSEVTLEGDDDRLEEIQKFINEWAADNINIVKVKACNYWDGHNYKSIIIDGEFGEEENSLYKVLDDEETQKYIDLYKRAEFGSWSFGKRTANIDGYTVIQTQYTSDISIATIEEVEE